MAIRIVRLGSPRKRSEGIRIGTVRRPPRGVRKADYARLDFYDTWLPQLAPSAGLLSWVRTSSRHLILLEGVRGAIRAGALIPRQPEAAGPAGCILEEHRLLDRVLLRGRSRVPSIHTREASCPARSGDRGRGAGRTGAEGRTGLRARGSRGFGGDTRGAGMQAYGKLFARVYNKYWGAFSNTCAAQLLRLFSEDPGSAGSGSPRALLDICCGTGQLSHHFLEHGYTVWGIDLSPHMIEWAIANNREHVDSGAARFLVADAVSFSIPRKVSHATCLYDAVNHLASISEIGSCIQAAHDALEDGGLFVFDMNTRRSLRRWNAVSVQEDEEMFFLNKAVYEESMDRAYTQVTGFVRVEGGGYERFSETVYNLALSTSEVMDAVRRAGFTLVRCAALPDLAVPVEDPEAVQRPFFICRKG